MLNLVLAGILLLEPWLFGHVIDSLVAQSHDQAWRYIGYWAAFGLGGIAAGVWVSLQSDRLAHRRRLAVITEFFEHAIGLPLSFHGEHHTGRLLRVMHSGATSLFSIWLGFLRDHLATILSILVMLPVAFSMNWKLAILMIGLMAVSRSSTPSPCAARRRRRPNRTSAPGDRRAHRRCAENAAVVQSFTRHDAEVDDIRKLTQRVLEAQYPVLRGWAWMSVATRAASTLTIVGIFLLGASLNGKGEVTVGNIVTFSGFAMTLIGRLEQLSGFISALFFQIPSLREFFADPRYALGAEGGARHARPAAGARRGGVRARFVRLQPGAPGAARHLCFRAPPGRRSRWSGPTGAGKTTALSLLYRAYDPTAGRITVDGIDIRTVSLNSLRSNIAVVFQDPGLLYRSIADNIKLGRPDATQEQVEMTARAAEAHDFIVVKPEGYGTLVAERGRSLSGGERQRLAIARAMLKDAPILILDEATSALDNATEARIQRALDGADPGPHHVRHCAPPLDGARCGPDPGAEGRRAGRAGPLRRTASAHNGLFASPGESGGFQGRCRGRRRDLHDQDVDLLGAASG